jgi:transposase
MSLRLQPVPSVPEETARVARAAFPRGNTYLALWDELGTVFADEDFATLYPTRGQPAEAPWRLALVTVWQFVEQLSDRQAADAVRGRIDWKYALGLGRTDPGFDSTVLSEFRTRLLAGSAEQRLLDTLLDRCRQRGWLKARGRQRTDSTHVLARIRAVNRLECVRATLRHALNTLAAVAPAWLRAHRQAEWAGRYGQRLDDSRLLEGCQEGGHGLRRARADSLQGSHGYVAERCAVLRLVAQKPEQGRDGSPRSASDLPQGMHGDPLQLPVREGGCQCGDGRLGSGADRGQGAGRLMPDVGLTVAQQPDQGRHGVLGGRAESQECVGGVLAHGRVVVLEGLDQRRECGLADLAQGFSGAVAAIVS